MKTITAALAVAAASATLGGCSYQLVSPPARMVALQSARAAAPGETVIGAKGAVHAAVFDPGAQVATAGVRHGVADGVELDGELTWAYVLESSHPDINRNIYAARTGVKLSNRGGWAAAIGGVGGGFAPAAGGFAAVDTGVVFSVPNCWVVPFGNVSLFASQPIAARQVDFRREDGTIGSSSTAHFTYGLGLGAGFEIPLDHARCREGKTPARIQLGGNIHTLRRTDSDRVTTTTTSTDGTTTTTTETGSDRYGAFGLALGFEIPF